MMQLTAFAVMRCLRQHFEIALHHFASLNKSRPLRIMYEPQRILSLSVFMGAGA